MGADQSGRPPRFPRDTTVTAITYLQFHGLFLLPPLVALGTVSVRRRTEWHSAHWAGTAIILALALAYTTPWDNYLIERGVWWYGEGAVTARLWLAPIEEYLFIVFQTVLAALWLTRLRVPDADDVSVAVGDRIGGALAGVAVGVAGAVLALRGGETFYLGALLAWAGPVLAVQWGFGWPVLWRARRTVGAGVVLPTAYFCVVDRIALSAGTWQLSELHTTGISLLGLPVEEATFFLTTTLFVVQGLVLFDWVIAE